MKSTLLLLLLLLPSPLLALDFTLHQQQGVQPGPTLLIIGGIQGDEPGGFNAAASQGRKTAADVIGGGEPNSDVGASLARTGRDCRNRT